MKYHGQNEMIATTIPTNTDMADRIKHAASILFDANILTAEGRVALEQVSTHLRSAGEYEWSYSVARNFPVSFQALSDNSGEKYQPQIGVEKISIINEVDNLPFESWDIALLLKYSNQNIHCPRWHFDLCNTGQNGPITHLQYSGHRHDNVSLNCRLKEPRWCLPPYDIILLCESVAANFYHDEWNSSLRNNRSWVKIVKSSQKLCYPYFLRQLYTSLNASETPTLLDGSWNNRYC